MPVAHLRRCHTAAMDVTTFAARIAMRAGVRVKVDIADMAICDLPHSPNRRIGSIDLNWFYRFEVYFPGCIRVFKRSFEMGITDLPRYFGGRSYLSNRMELCALGEGGALLRRDRISR
jgi:hypothetical protein